MPKHLTLASAIDKNRISSTTAWIVALEISVIDPTTGILQETRRICANDVALTIDGDLYDAFPFSIDVKEKSGELPSVSVSLVDVTRQVQYLLQLYEGGLGFPVTMLIVPVDDDSIDQSLEPDLVEYFTVLSTSSDSSSYTTSWTLGAENPVNIVVPRRSQFRDRCSFEFLSTQCGYTGLDQTCTRALNGANGCVEKGNQDRYGGFPGINLR
tara:strand:+ start:1627 stop:2262 length:636 start_codon:yes stop_codon:yes gene_type:complete